MRPRWPLLLTVVAALAAGCGTARPRAEAERDVARGDQGEILIAGEVGVLRLQVGDCFNDPPPGPMVTVDAVPCRSPHDSEVIGIFEFPDGAWPGEDVVADQSLRECERLFLRVVGVGAERSAATLTALAPTPDSWGDDRSVLCIAEAADGEASRGSLTNAGA